MIEIVSPGDESWQKQPFYAAHDVDEILIVDPAERAVHWLALTDGKYRTVERSRVIELGPVDLAARIDWPGDRLRAIYQCAHSALCRALCENVAGATGSAA